MRLFVQEATKPFADYVLSFALRNPYVGQPSPVLVLISSSGSVVIDARPMSQSPNNSAPLLVAGFLKTRVYQNEAESVVYAVNNTVGVPSVRPNTITIDFSTTCSLVTNSTVVLKNLTLSPTQSTSNMPLSCVPVGFISSQGTWVRETGTLSIPVLAGTSAHLTYVCTVTLNGPLQAQIPPTLSLQVNGTRISQVLPDTVGGKKRPFGLEVWCAPYPMPSNGVLYPETSVKSPGYVTLTCQHAYILKVASVSKFFERPVCRSDGTWSSTDIACEKIRGALFSWGSNNKGQVGDATSVERLTPTPVAPGSIVGDVSLVVAGEEHSMALTANGTLYTWGSNEFGQLGYGTKGGTHTTPRTCQFGPSSFKMASAGQSHSVVLDDEGSVWGFGAGDVGQLGNGLTTNEVFAPAKPQLPAGTKRAVLRLAVHTCLPLLVEAPRSLPGAPILKGNWVMAAS